MRVVIGAIVVGAVTAAGASLLGSAPGRLSRALKGPTIPLSVVAHQADPGETCGGGLGWVFSRVPNRLPQVGANFDYGAWAARYGGIPADGNFIEATIQGRSSRAVVLMGLTVQVLSRRAPPTGAYPVFIGQCGGIDPDLYTANLDATPVRIDVRVGEAVGGDGEARLVRPPPFPHKISAGEPEVWRIQARTKDCDCQWVGYLHWASAGREGTLRIDDHGRPFRTAAVTDAASVKADGRGWAPEPRGRSRADLIDKLLTEAAKRVPGRVQSEGP
jgi:hypothetical protein